MSYLIFNFLLPLYQLCNKCWLLHVIFLILEQLRHCETKVFIQIKSNGRALSILWTYHSFFIFEYHQSNCHYTFNSSKYTQHGSVNIYTDSFRNTCFIKLNGKPNQNCPPSPPYWYKSANVDRDEVCGFQIPIIQQKMKIRLIFPPFWPKFKYPTIFKTTCKQLLSISIKHELLSNF